MWCIIMKSVYYMYACSDWAVKPQHKQTLIDIGPQICDTGESFNTDPEFSIVMVHVPV